MRSNTQCISIDVPPADIVRFLADPQNLPRWAVGFAKAVKKQGDQWLVITGTGELPIRIEANEACGIVDFWISVAPGVDALAASRAVPRGSGSEYTFTQFQAPGMPDEVFQENIKAVQHELNVLKAIAEIKCPL